MQSCYMKLLGFLVVFLKKKKLKLNKKLWGLVFNLLSFILKLKTRIFLKKDNACEAIEH